MAARYIARTGKPLEANVPHHFAFRGADDVTYVLSAYLTARLAKSLGVKHFVLQNMLNTPRYTWGIQDLAKSLALLKIIRELEDANFKAHFQTRTALEYFSPDYETAKAQLAAVTALMDDIEPLDDNSPEIIHVVSFCEAARLADPPVIEESVKITLEALRQYRMLRKKDKVENMARSTHVDERFSALYEEVKDAAALLETHIPYLYTPEGFFKIFCDGFLPVPYLIDENNKYPKARAFQTQIIDGGVKVVNAAGEVIPTTRRFRALLGV